MFLLNPEKIDQVKEAVGVFTIQNVPIKSEVVREARKYIAEFTIQNVPIKSYIRLCKL